MDDMISVLRHHASVDGDRTAIEAGHVSFTYGELDDRSDGIATSLARLGLGRGDRAIAVLGADPWFFPTWLAVLKVGAVLVPINPDFTAADATPVVQAADPALSIVSTGWRDHAEVALANRPIVWCGADDAGDLRLDELAASERGSWSSVESSAYASLLFTSGTTAGPKGVVHDHEYWNSFARFGYGAALGMGPETRYLNVMPPFHINGMGFGWSVLERGGTLVQKPRFSASAYWEWVREHDIDRSFLISAMAMMLLSRPSSPDDRSHRLRLAGTAALPAERIADFEERFGVALVASYGMTEGGGACERPARRRPGSSGEVTQGVELRLVDEEGREVGPGVAGTVEIRDLRGGLAVGYWNVANDDGQLVRPIRSAGWFRTTDIARFDEDGFLHFVGRTRDIVRRAAENIATVEIEDVLRSHPEVADAAVVGVPDPMVDEELKAFIEARDGATVDLGSVVEHARRNLAKFKVPRYWVVADELPRTPTLRVQKHLLDSTGEGADLDLRQGSSNDRLVG